MSNVNELPDSNDNRTVRDAIWLRECRERREAAWSAFYDACRAARVDVPRYGEDSYAADKDSFRLALADRAALRMLWVAWRAASSEEQLAEEASKARAKLATSEAALCATARIRRAPRRSRVARGVTPTTTATRCARSAASAPSGRLPRLRRRSAR